MRNHVLSLLRGPWGWRARWPLFTGAATALTGLVVTLLLVVPGGSKDGLLTATPTPSATPTAAPTPSASPAASPDGSVDASPRASAEARPPRPQLDVEHLLSDGYVNRSFGQGRTSLVGTWRHPGAPVACRTKNDGDVRVARTWAWPDEIVVGETLTVHDTEGSASAALAECRELSPLLGSEGVTSGPMDVGDEGYISTYRGELFTQLNAGARVGKGLVLVVWRQSGPITSSAPLEAALRAAVAKVAGQAEGAPVAAPAQRTPTALDGFLTYAQVAAFAQREDGWIGMNWRWDLRSTSPGVMCGDPGQSPLPTRDRPVSRSWIGGLIHADDGFALGLTIASAAEGSDPATDFDDCRERAASQGYSPSDVGDLGDEAFVVDWGTSNDTPTVYVRAGSTYLVVTTDFLSSDDVVALAGLALDRYLAATATASRYDVAGAAPG